MKRPNIDLVKKLIENRVMSVTDKLAEELVEYIEYLESDDNFYRIISTEKYGKAVVIKKPSETVITVKLKDIGVASMEFEIDEGKEELAQEWFDLLTPEQCEQVVEAMLQEVGL